MANLSPEDHTIIIDHPLDDSLDHLREVLQKAEYSYTLEMNPYDGAADGSDQALQKATSKLLDALLTSDAAFYLHLKIGGNQDMATELLRIRKRIQNGDYNYENYRALSQLVIKKASDVKIWNAVFDLTITLFQTSPPESVVPSFDGTPITHSSASHQGSEQTKDFLEGPLFHEIKNCTYRGVDGFFSKYFEGKEWSEQGKEIYNAVKDRHIDGQWSDFPSPPEETAVWEWICHFQEEFLSKAQGVYYTTKSTKDLTGAEARRQLDLFIKRRGETASTIHDWKDVQVIGELKLSNKEWKQKLLQLSRYMRDVFSTQPTRRFIHGFTILGITMELWVFDRSGPYSSGPFNIHKEPERFIRTIAGYAMMSDEELGLDTFIERDGGNLFITIAEDTTRDEKRLQLIPDPLVVQRAIVCRGTNCYRTKDSKSVAKFAWASNKRPSEIDLLRMAYRKGVKGVARMVGYHRITSIQEMRDGLIFPAPYHFRNTSSKASASFSQSQSQQRLSQSFESFQRSSFSETSSKTSSKKRKSLDNETESSKRPRPNRRRSKLDQEHKATEPEDAQTKEHEAADKKATSFKKPTSVSQRSKSYQEHEVSEAPEITQTRKGRSENGEKSFKQVGSNSQTSSLRQGNKASQAVENMQASNFYDPIERLFNDRLFGCLVISPAGQPISKFNSIPRLLTALRDAITAHRSLYLDGNILHRDVSENNIILTIPEKADGFTGMLIDLDLAIEVGGGRTGAQRKTGTMEFMAIEVLREYDHTYRHDIESFFYVLIWICARRAWEREFECNSADRPQRNILQKWYSGTYDDIADAKEHHMGISGFEAILREFPQAFDCVKPLCKKIRGILFPFRKDGSLDTGTPTDPKKLYGPILKAFDEAIAEIAGADGSW